MVNATLTTASEKAESEWMLLGECLKLSDWTSESSHMEVCLGLGKIHMKQHGTGELNKDKDPKCLINT